VRYLDYYTAPDANADTVLVGVTDLGNPPMKGVIAGSDAVLTSAATAAGHSTWDQDTICAVHALHRKPDAPAVP
jgi:hypothetical protein